MSEEKIRTDDEERAEQNPVSAEDVDAESLDEVVGGMAVTQEQFQKRLG